jgi:hypothetical protein
MSVTPPCPKGLYEFHYEICDVNLLCHLEYIPAIRGSRDSWGANYEPDEDEQMILYACYVYGNDQDISSLLEKFYVKEIEIVALNKYKVYE